MINLWLFDVSLVTYKTTELVRLKHRFDSSYFGVRDFRDLDTKNSLGDAGAFARTTSFIRDDLGFSFPLPVGPRTAKKIFRGVNYPTLEQWEKFAGEGYYARDDYHRDLAIFYKIGALPRTHDEHYQYVKKTYRIINAISSQQNQASYAQMAIRNYLETQRSLVQYFPEFTVPDEVMEMLQKLGVLVAKFVPEHKASNKKMLQASDNTNTVIEKKKRQRKVVANQTTIW